MGAVDDRFLSQDFWWNDEWVVGTTQDQVVSFVVMVGSLRWDGPWRSRQVYHDKTNGRIIGGIWRPFDCSNDLVLGEIIRCMQMPNRRKPLRGETTGPGVGARLRMPLKEKDRQKGDKVVRWCSGSCAVGGWNAGYRRDGICSATTKDQSASGKKEDIKKKSRKLKTLGSNGVKEAMTSLATGSWLAPVIRNEGTDVAQPG